TDTRKRTMLHFACAHGHVATTRLLLNLRQKHFLSSTTDEEDADDNALAARRMLAMRDVNGSSPLHLAIAGNHLPIINLLLRAGADLTATDASGRTPISLVKSRLRTLSLRHEDNISGKQLNTKLMAELNEMIDILAVYHARAESQALSESQIFSGNLDELVTKFKALETGTPSTTENEIEALINDIGSLLFIDEK
ncbi:hypothetical protein HDU99_001417, partial [Rhizoclosmatium hyalinum]